MGVTFDELRTALNDLAMERGEWAGYPMVIEGLRLTVEPHHPFPALNGMGGGLPDEPPGVEVDPINSWFSDRLQAQIIMFREDGRIRYVRLPGYGGQKLRYWFNTLVAASQAWSVEMEQRAIEKLRTLISDHAMKCYLLSNCFLETSPRSRVSYMFRKSRPTIAMVSDKGEMRVIGCLCLHPIGYYQESWAGVLCPTDDVIAHLMLMRGNEHGFWKKANNHGVETAQAGL